MALVIILGWLTVVVVSWMGKVLCTPEVPYEKVQCKIVLVVQDYRDAYWTTIEYPDGGRKVHRGSLGEKGEAISMWRRGGYYSTYDPKPYLQVKKGGRF